MKPLEMDVYMDHVEIEGQVVKRPVYIQRSWWMIFWESINPSNKHKDCPWCGHELD